MISQIIKNKILLLALLCFSLIPGTMLRAKNYKGAELRTKDSFTYGRFEVRMKPPAGSGFLSSFFTFHDFQTSSEWNEIDVEILARYDHNVQVTSIGPYQKIRPSHQWVPFNTHDGYHVYTFEWTPDYIAWFVDGEEIYRQNDTFIADFHYPQKIMMNLWNPQWQDWAGEWFDAQLPIFSYYDWVSYAAYTPNAGNCGTNNNFTLQWKDDFDAFNADRWQKATHTFDGNNCDFTPENIVFKDGKMILCLTDNDHLGLVDKNPPQMLYVWMLDSTVFARFSEELDSVSATTVGNFRIPGLPVKPAKLQSDRRAVELKVSTPQEGRSYNLAVLGIKDRAQPANVQIGQVFTIKRLQWLPFPIRINAGGEAFGDYLGDQQWRPDRMYGHQDGFAETFYQHPHIAGCANDSVYWTELHEAVTYKIRVPNGLYRLVLHLAENKVKESGQRVFDIVAENRKIAENLDPIAQYGFQKAVCLQADSLQVNDGILDIHLVNRVGVSLLNAIEIFPLQTGLSFGRSSSVPGSFRCLPNYPNPFNNRTVFPVALPENGTVRLRIFNLQGQLIFNKNYRNLTAGSHLIPWQANAASGIYLVQMIYSGAAERQIQTKKIVLLK